MRVEAEEEGEECGGDGGTRAGMEAEEGEARGGQGMVVGGVGAGRGGGGMGAIGRKRDDRKKEER